MDSARIARRKLREAKGELTQRAFARKLGISSGQMSCMLTAPKYLTVRTLAKISRPPRDTSQLLDDADTHHRRR